MRTLENCGVIKLAVKKGMSKPYQADGKCAGYQSDETKEGLMPACSWCKLNSRMNRTE